MCYSSLTFLICIFLFVLLKLTNFNEGEIINKKKEIKCKLYYHNSLVLRAVGGIVAGFNNIDGPRRVPRAEVNIPDPEVSSPSTLCTPALKVN